MKRAEKRLIGLVRRAIQDYRMIGGDSDAGGGTESGGGAGSNANSGNCGGSFGIDRIAVGVSGGKDSMSLLYSLRRLMDFFPVKYELEAITVSLGFDGFDPAPISEFCERIGVRHTVEETSIGKIVFEARSEENPCSLCANMRRGALNNTALRLQCNKVALAHSRDDAVETFLLSLFYEGRINTFSPVTYLRRSRLSIIRPLIYVQDKIVREFVKEFGITPVENPCPASGNSKRLYVRQLLRKLSEDNRKVKGNIFGAFSRSGTAGWNAEAPEEFAESPENETPSSGGDVSEDICTNDKTT